jgi:DNA-binding NarL/FixJ family response regulator
VDAPRERGAAPPTPASGALLRRERDALALAAHGLSPKGIALVLLLPARIVEELLRRCCWRLGAADVAAAVRLARRRRLIA